MIEASTALTIPQFWPHDSLDYRSELILPASELILPANELILPASELILPAIFLNKILMLRQKTTIKKMYILEISSILKK